MLEIDRKVYDEVKETPFFPVFPFFFLLISYVDYQGSNKEKGSDLSRSYLLFVH